MMNTEERNQLIVEKLNEGLSLSEIQNLLEEQHSTRMTYMDLRVLASELENVDWSQQSTVSFKEQPIKNDELLDRADEPEAGGSAGAKISISKLARPGAAMSGRVEFSSGSKAEWILGNDGRLALQPEPGAAKPSEQDIQEFQEELQKMVYGTQ